MFRSYALVVVTVITALTALTLMPTRAAQASSIVTTLVPFTGTSTEVELTLSDDAGDGTIHGRLVVTEGVGDLRALFLNVTNVSLLAGLDVEGQYATSLATGSVDSLGHGANVKGGGSPCPCDIGIGFGSPGIARDDLQIVEFVLKHVSESLSLSIFGNQFAGVRVTSVGLDELDRRGSSKLVGVVPEPGTALLLAAGLGVLGAHRRARALAR